MKKKLRNKQSDVRIVVNAPPLHLPEFKQYEDGLAEVENLLDAEFIEDLEFKVVQMRATRDEQRAAELLCQIYRYCHSRVSSHSCYPVHQNWREEPINPTKNEEN